MASRHIEDQHLTALQQLLVASGLECTRSPAFTSSFEEEDVDVPDVTAIPEPKIEEEQEQEEPPEVVQAPPQEIVVKEPYVFPTPSLRKVLPDNIRKIELQNRIHVLPEEFKTNIDPSQIPKIASTSPQKYIDTLAELVGCKMYRSSLAEYWCLHTMAGLLRRAQEDGCDAPTQAILMVWFCEWMKEMQHFDAADRERMMRRFQDNMLNAAAYVADEERIPLPEDIGVTYKAQDTPPSTHSALEDHQKSGVTFDENYVCSLRDLTRIIHYIFDLFSTDFQYDLVRSIFTTTPGYELIDAPYQIQVPKRMYVPLKVKVKKEKEPKKEKPGKGKKKEPDTAEFIALMQLKSKEEKELQEIEEREMEEWNKRSHVLPLHMSPDAGEELLHKYWPPPEPEPVVVPEPTKTKGKK